GIEQDRQVLLMLLLELLDHRLTQPRRGPPVDPSRAIARPVVSQAVIFLLLGRDIMASPSSSLARFAIDMLPAPGELAARGVDRQQGRIADRDPTFQEAEGRPRREVEGPESVLPSSRG